MSNSKEPKPRKVEEGQVFNSSDKPKEGHSDTPKPSKKAAELEAKQVKANERKGKLKEDENSGELVADVQEPVKEEKIEDKK